MKESCAYSANSDLDKRPRHVLRNIATFIFFRAWLEHVAVLILKPLSMSPYRLAEAVAAGAADVRKHPDDHSGMRAMGLAVIRQGNMNPSCWLIASFRIFKSCSSFFVVSYLYSAGFLFVLGSTMHNSHGSSKQVFDS
jgi:hypothetical protein